MDPATALALAHESLAICIQIGKKVRKYIVAYREALSGIEEMGVSATVAYNTAIEFEKSLEQLPLPLHEEIIKVFDRLSCLFGDISILLSRYDDGKPVGTVRKGRWAIRGKGTADKIKAEIDNWIRQVYPLVLTSLVRVGVVKVLVQQTEVLKRVDENISELQKSMKDLPGIEAGVEMRAVQEAMKFSASSGRKVEVQTNWKPIVIDLSQSLEISPPQVQTEEESELEGNYSFATINLQASDPPEKILLEHRRFDSDTHTVVKDSADQVAHIISKVDPGFFNVPKCLGYFEDSSASRYSLILSRQFHVNHIGLVSATRFTLENAISLLQTQRLPIPIGTSKPRLDKVQLALLQCLNDLESRTTLAIELIRALSYIHAVDWVHKSFRSDNIILCLDAETSRRVVPLIVGFHRARHINANSDKKETLLWQDIIYRHPDRWLESNNPTFKPAYDDYSLGVILLEVGLGKLAGSFVRNESPVLSSTTTPAPREAVEEMSTHVVETYLKQARLLQNKQGPTYFSVVKKCLELGIDPEGAKSGFLAGLLEELSSVKY